MDRRQRKTREAIFNAFCKLLSKKDFNKITVGEIISLADVGRATFYSHFETKDFLVKELCEELFCHLFDTASNDSRGHRHIFSCDCSDTVFLHMLRHIQKNDNSILLLLSSENNEIFLKYFKNGLEKLIEENYDMFKNEKYDALPKTFIKNHIASTFTETLKWWIENGMVETPEKITEYFFTVS